MQKKVLFLIHTLGAGGAEKVLVNLVNHMSSDYDVTVMTVIDTGVFKKDLSDQITYKTMFKVPFQKSNKKDTEKEQSGSLLNKTSRIKKIIAKCYSTVWKFMPTRLLYRLKIRDKYDIEVAFLEGICAKIIASSNQDSKKIAWIHVDIINEKKSDAVFRNQRVATACYERFDQIVAVSDGVRQQFIKKFNYNPEKVVVKHNAIDSFEITEKAKENISIPLPTEFKMVTIGRLSKQKGYDRLLSIVNRLKEEQLSFHLWIIGVGPKEKELKQYVVDYQLQNYVDFLGFQSNPFPYLKVADLFVCSSRAEGFSTVACEATVLGTPIVTTDCSGMRELLGDSEYGLITENTENALYEGLKSILTTQEKYQYYKSQIQKIKNKFDIKTLVAQTEEMFGDTNEYVKKKNI